MVIPQSQGADLMLGVGYVRVSTEDQARNGVSLEAQTAAIQAWAASLQVSILMTCEDAGISGTGIRQRPGLQQALQVACEKKAVLVIYSLSRLSRSTKDTLQIAERLDKAGADLVSLSERIDTTSASGKMVFRLMAVLNEFERDQVAERTAAVLQHKKAQGLVYSPVPYGYERRGDTLIIDKVEQEVLRRIRRMRDDGLSLRRIADALNREGVPAKNGGRWYASTIRYILRNRIHGGDG
jgi:site-specific DNA recombinase